MRSGGGDEPANARYGRWDGREGEGEGEEGKRERKGNGGVGKSGHATFQETRLLLNMPFKLDIVKFCNLVNTIPVWIFSSPSGW